jgi:mycothiol S-conjugate amidase
MSATPRDHDGNPLCLLTVHAHPDDEASKGAGTVAAYSDAGIRCVLVCCTGGEAGDILNPAVDTPEVRAELHAVRMAELQASADILGYSAVHLLGYHDSGMPKTETNARPDNFANAPIDEAVERLVRLIREERPQVIVTYDEDRKFYPHPDHIRVHEISVPAFDAAGDPERFPDAGDPWQPSKLYYTGWSKRRVTALHEAHIRRGEESPFTQWFERGLPEGETAFTTFIDVGDTLPRRRAALLAHRTQVDPEGFWMRLPDDVLRETFPWEEYVLARSLVDTGVADGEPEDDLFAGLRASVRSST